MCLETISQVNGLKDGVGYKVFEIKNGRPYGFMQGDRYKEYEVEKWLHERKFRVVSSRKLETDKYTSRAKYSVGFHIFRRKKDALKWCHSAVEALIFIGSAIEKRWQVASNSWALMD